MIFDGDVDWRQIWCWLTGASRGDTRRRSPVCEEVPHAVHRGECKDQGRCSVCIWGTRWKGNKHILCSKKCASLSEQVVKVIWHKTASAPQTDGLIVFARWRQCAHPCGRPTRVHNPNGKPIGSAVFAQLTAESPYTLQWATLSPKLALLMGDLDPHLIHNSLGYSEITVKMASWSIQLFAQVTTECPYPLLWAHVSPEIAPSLRVSGPHLNTIPWGHPSPQPKRHLDRFCFFFTQMMAVFLYFTMGRPFPPSILPLPMGGSGPPSNTWFPRPNRVLNPNGISIGSVVFAGLTSVTDHATRSVTVDRIYIRSTVMRSKNVKSDCGSVVPLLSDGTDLPLCSIRSCCAFWCFWLYVGERQVITFIRTVRIVIVWAPTCTLC